MAMWVLGLVPVRAATTIQNTAHVSLSVDGHVTDLASNTVSTVLGTVVDVGNTAIAATPDTIDQGITGYSYSFRVTNNGTVSDVFELSAGFSNVSAPVVALWLDANNDGVVSAADTRLSTDTLTLAPGQSVSIIVTSQAAGTMQLTATSLNSDPDAVVHHRFVTAQVTPTAAKSGEGADQSPSLVKTQTVDTQGAAQPGSGTLITYSLTSHIPAGYAASDIRIGDTAPAGTTYVPGSLSLDNAPLSDSGAYDAASHSISVALPGADGSTSDTHTVRFQVRIN